MADGFLFRVLWIFYATAKSLPGADHEQIPSRFKREMLPHTVIPLALRVGLFNSTEPCVYFFRCTIHIDATAFIVDFQWFSALAEETNSIEISCKKHCNEEKAAKKSAIHQNCHYLSHKNIWMTWMTCPLHRGGLSRGHPKLAQAHHLRYFHCLDIPTFVDCHHVFLRPQFHHRTL